MRKKWEKDEGEEAWRLTRRKTITTTTTKEGEQRWMEYLLHIPVEASVSKYEAEFQLWRFNAQTAETEKRDGSSQHPGWTMVFDPLITKCFVLFNPWCRRDDVFLEDEAQREEYVLNDVGRIFTGSWESPRSRKWNYGQFEPDCMEAAFEIVSRIDEFDGRSDVVNVMRTVSQMLNAMDEDNGVLEGNWSGIYYDGR